MFYTSVFLRWFSETWPLGVQCAKAQGREGEINFFCKFSGTDIANHDRATAKKYAII